MKKHCKTFNRENKIYRVKIISDPDTYKNKTDPKHCPQDYKVADEMNCFNRQPMASRQGFPRHSRLSHDV